MTSRIEARIATLGRIDAAAAQRVADDARRRVEWEEPTTRQHPRPHYTWPRRRVAVAAALAMLLAGALVFAIRPWGGGPANAALLRRVQLAVTPPPHTVQHIRQILHQGSTVVTTESWQSIDDPGTLRWRQTQSTCGGWVTDNSSTLTEQQWFDADNNRVLRTPLVPAKVRASWPAAGPRTEFDPTVPFARALENGQAHVSGSTAIDGVAATQISWPADAATDPTSRNILYVNTTTGVPIAYAWGGGKLDATGGVVAQQLYPTYEFIPEGPATARALSESAAHPNATLMPLTSQRQFDASYQDAQRAHCTSVG